MSRSERETERPTSASEYMGLLFLDLRLGWACSADSGNQFLLFRPWHRMFPGQSLVSERLKAAGGRMALSHKGRYWQISDLEKQVGLRAIIYISAPAGECSKGRFRALLCGAKRSERTPVSDAPSPPVPFFLTLPEGRAAPAGIVAGPTAWLVDQT